MALNRSDKSRILRRYFPGMTRNSEMSTEPNEHTKTVQALPRIARPWQNCCRRVKLTIQISSPGIVKNGEWCQ